MYKRNSKGWAKHFDFLLIDILCVEIAFIVAFVMRHHMSNPFERTNYVNLVFTLAFIDFALVLFLETLKDVLKRGRYREFIVTLRHSIMLLLVVTMYLFAVQEGERYSRITIFLMTVIYMPLTYIMRLLWKKRLRHWMKEQKGNNLLILSNEERAPEIIRNVEENNYTSYNIVGVVVHDDYKVGRKIRDVDVVATYDNVIEYVKNNWVDEVLLSVPARYKFPIDVYEELIEMGVAVHLNIEATPNVAGTRQVLAHVGELSVITTTLNYMTPRQSAAKRLLDIIGGLAGCLLTGILYLILAPKIKKESPGPVFFEQTRIGLNGKPFKIYKFRSMYMDAEERKKELMEQNRIEGGLMFKMEFDPRVIGNKIDKNGNQVTGIGEKIRKYSLDEFPQFLNVLKGDMSLVGTRPPVMEEYQQYEAHHRARLATKPGITGMWQVSGRSNILDFEEVVRLDTEYINNWTIGLDIKILLKTIKVVVKKEGSM